MKTKLKHISLILFAILAMIACERDEICIDEITPNLIIRFYDFDDQTETKSINQLSVKINGIDNDSLFFSGTDSIFVPLIVTGNSTQFVFTTNSTDAATLNRDTLTVNYTPEAIFVGRSCGFKSIFTETSYTLTIDNDNWMENNFEIVTQTIENETAAHVKIFH